MNVPNGCDGRISTKLHPKKQERKIASSCSDEADSILAEKMVKGAIWVVLYWQQCEAKEKRMSTLASWEYHAVDM